MNTLTSMFGSLGRRSSSTSTNASVKGASPGDRKIHSQELEKVILVSLDLRNAKTTNKVMSTVYQIPGHHVNRLSVRCKCKFQNENGQTISFSFCLRGWNESCGSSCHEPRKIGSDHVFVSYNNCNVPVFQWSEESNVSNRCRPTSASFEFYLTDDTERKLEYCKVIRCGMNLLYAPDENDRGFQGTRVKDNVERASSEAFVPVRGRSHSQVGERRNGRIRDKIPL